MVAQAIDDFIFELGQKESNAKKCRKINALSMDNEEWMRVRLFCNILQVSIMLCHETTARGLTRLESS